MDPTVSDWLHLFIRWMHVIAGIMWIGSSIFFNWLDGHLTKPDKAGPGVEGELWMVHSGGFYQVEKKLVAPSELPATLHWFKWEAAFTWISGIMLLGVVYYMGGGMLLVDREVSNVSVGAAIGIGMGTLVVGWAIYDALWNSSLGKSGTPAIVVSFALLIAVAYGLSRVLSGRAAYMHVGALLGTVMVANVWMRIIPAQRGLVEAVRAGKKPDAALAARAKQRSRHNNYMTYPVLFVMISNHFPETYGNKLGWMLLGGFFILGAAIRHYQNTRGGTPRLLFAVIGIGFVASGAISAMRKRSRAGSPGDTHATAPVDPPKTTGGVGSTQAAAMNLDPATVGFIAGVAHFAGTAPAQKELVIPSTCASDKKGPVYEGTVLVAEGGLQNVFVRISEGLGSFNAPPPKEEVVVDQRGCIYSPHVVGVQANQPVTFLNSDPVMHNVHALSEGNPSFNAGLPGKASKITRTFEAAEIMVHMKCDVHPWMSNYIGVVTHPYFAVTGAKGEYSLGNVPPGEYVLEAWHEVYGKQTTKVSLAPKGAAVADFNFKGE